MQIQVNTDHTIEGHEALADHIRGVVENALSRMSDHITRVEVHLTDERGPKNGKNDKRCMMEARLEGRQPIAVTDEAAALDLAVNGAADKLARLIENTLGKLRDERRDDLGLPNRFDVYYGMADSRIGVARLDLPDVSPPEGVADSPEAKV